MKEVLQKKSKVVPLERAVTASEPGLLRLRVRSVVDGKWVTVLMAVIAIWVLFGDDIKVMTTGREADLGFAVSYVFSLSLFIIEIIVNSLVVDDYKFSFFFWLDVIAALSLLPDIYLIINPIMGLFNQSMANVDVTVDTSGIRNEIKTSYINRVWRSVRFIRLVRIVKLYKYFTKGKSSMIAKKAQEKSESLVNPMQTHMDPAALGRKLSDITTRRVIIMVLLILVILPILQSNVIDNSRYYGLQQLFWVGRSLCKHSDDFGCTEKGKPFVNEYGWYDLLRRYSRSSEDTEGGSLSAKLLWLKIPSFLHNGNLTEITSIPADYWGFYEWSEESDCAGETITSSCSLRDNEMDLIAYSPETCMNHDTPGCEEMLAYARFDVSSAVQQESLLNVFVTIFVGIILALASVTFGLDTQRIVIRPITKMVLLIKNLADDPLHMQETSTNSRSGEKTENSILEETLARIGNLIKVSFGHNNEEIVSAYINADEMDMSRSGNTVRLIFGLVKIQKFTEITDLLQEQVLLFLNKIGRIVHACTGEWKGTPIKNDMGTFLVIWEQGHQNATQALLSFIKIIAETRRASDITIYKNNPKISAKWPDYQVELGLSLHLGWAVQGVIGSDKKLDIAYFSPHLELGQQVLEATALYQTSILMTEVFYEELPKKAREYCRRVDTVVTPLEPQPIGLYSYDMNDTAPPVSVNPSIRVGAPFLLLELEQTAGDLISIDVNNYDDLFLIESDVVTFQKNLVNAFTELWKRAYKAYTEGSWPEAMAIMDQCRELRPDDGPMKSLYGFMEDNGHKAPESWNGTRSLV